MNEQIYIILKSLDVNGENYYESVPSTWCESAEDASELLKKTVERFKEWYPDLEVLALKEDRLHVHYTDDEGQKHDATYWVRDVRKFGEFAW